MQSHENEDKRALSFKARLYKTYTEKLKNDEYITPDLDLLIHGIKEEENGSFRIPALPGSENRSGAGVPPGVAPPDFPPVDSMGGDNRIEFTQSPGHCWGGYDGGCEVGFKGKWDLKKFETLIAYFEENRKDGEQPVVVAAGREFILYPFGTNGQVHYRYAIEGEGWKVQIHQKPDCGGIQQIRVRYGFEALCGRTLFEVHEEFLQWLKEIGFSVEKETVSRVDLQVMTTRPVSEYFNAIYAGHLVRRFRQSRFFTDNGDVMSSWRAGSALTVRIYDKRRELIEKDDEVKALLIQKYCTGGIIPFNLTRIEFSLNRDILNDAAIDSVSDLKEVENTLAEYLTRDWFRLIDGPKTKGNERRTKTLQAWEEVQQLFARYFPGGENPRQFSRNERGVKGLRCTSEELKKQAVGCLASAFAKCEGKTDNVDDVVTFVLKAVSEFGQDIVEKIKERAAKLKALTGFDAKEQGTNYDPFDPRLALGNNLNLDRETDQ